ncbi:CD225/dispanin family protein [Cellulomonas sp. P5_C5]
MATEPIPSAAPDPTPPPPPPPPPTPAPYVPATTAPVGWVIAAMILFWPTGIPALLASHRAARALGAGDAVTAEREAANGRRWGIISVIVGAGLIVFSVLASIAWAFLIAVAFHEHGDGSWEQGPRWSNELPFDDGVSPGLPERPGNDR